MKYLVSAVVLILLIGLPAGSYYYLKSGFDYRKASLAALQPKESLVDHGMDMQLLGEKTSLLAVANTKNIEVLLKDLSRVHEQFEDAPTFQTCVVADSTQALKFKNTRFLLLDPSQFPSNLINESIDQMLIDTGGYVRQFYNSLDYKIDQLVEDIAIVLPRVKEKDIVEKKYETQ